ncbi:hypothetical protein VE00_11136 [Pseudogymnoascus sp. WSF 3629]|nr:hypothetical protein VE00_11136 [Pseudogymnoascus sp. WSF 3629]
MAMTSKEEIADLARIWDELETTFKRKEMFSKAESRLNENISVIENYANGDARQIMVSTDGKTLHGKNTRAKLHFKTWYGACRAFVIDDLTTITRICKATHQLQRSKL